MKKIVVLLAAFITGTAFAQNVGIGTDMPASKLTINGTDPDIGLMNNGLAHGFIKASGVNLNIGTASDNPTGKLILGTKDNNHFNIDHLGRVSIGTNSSFDASLKLNGTSPIFGFLHEEVQKGFIRLGGDNFKFGTYPGNSGKIIFSPKNVDKIWIDEDGLMGIGTSSPVSELTINGTNPYIQIQNGASNKGFLQAIGNNLKIGTNSTNTTGSLVMQTKLIDRMTIDENGLVGIGTPSPSSALTINGANPILQLRNNDVDKGFLQISGDNIKIGTNISNSTGNVIIRTNGVDRVNVDDGGVVTIGDATDGYVIIDSDQPGMTLQKNNLTHANVYVDDNTGDFIIEKTIQGNGRMVLRPAQGAGYNVYINENGQFNFGTGLHPPGYRFSIEGNVIATGFTTQTVANWPDYVFEKNYRLMPLNKVSEFIQANKHLPGIPSASEIEKKGVDLTEISRKLTEKVEELTLYILQQQEQIEELKKLVQPQRKND